MSTREYIRLIARTSFSILFFPFSVYTDNLPFNLEIAHMCRHTAKFVYNFACVFDCVFV